MHERSNLRAAYSSRLANSIMTVWSAAETKLSRGVRVSCMCCVE